MRTTPAPGGIDPETIATRQEFAAALTAVREAAGLTVREVGRAADIRPSTVGGYFSGRHLPPLRPDGGIRAILAACGVSDPSAVEAWQRALARIRRAPGPRPGALPPPYRGLAGYRPEDADRFHGRDAEVDLLVARLTAAPPPRGARGIVVLVGATGSGRTSLVAAGLLPRLRAAGHRVCVVRPGTAPLSDLSLGLAELGGTDLPGVGAPADVLVVDRFEALLAPDVDEGTRQACVRLLTATAAREPGASPSAAVLVVLRSDSLPAVLRRADLAAALGLAGGATGAELGRRPVTLRTPDDDTLREMIVGPARRVGVDVDDDLVEQILTDVAALRLRGEATLPRVSHALLETWRRGRRGRLTLAAYRQAGGVTGSVEQAAEAVFEALSPAARSALVGGTPSGATGGTIDAGSDDTGSDDTRSDDPGSDDARSDDTRSGDVGLDDEVVGAFAAAGLMDEPGGPPRAVPVGLLQGWPRARQWWPAPHPTLAQPGEHEGRQFAPSADTAAPSGSAPGDANDPDAGTDPAGTDPDVGTGFDDGDGPARRAWWLAVLLALALGVAAGIGVAVATGVASLPPY